jgi:hypothetical protein
MSKDSSTEQTAAGLMTTMGVDSNLDFSGKDIDLLRNLGRRVRELAERPQEQEKARLWTALNDLHSERPMIFIDPENGWNEIITQNQILLGNPLARVWEMHLRKEIFWAEGMKDDKVIQKFFDVPYNYRDTGWGLAETILRSGEEDGAFKYDSPIKDYSRDLEQLRFPEIIIDWGKTNSILTLAQSIFDGILEVRLRGVWWWSLGMTWDFIKLRGLENLMMDMYDHPDGVHALMSFLENGYLKKIDFLEERGLLALNTGGTYVGSGGFGWTQQLPQEDFNADKVRARDMWGFTESQETLGIAPAMFEEFIFPYQLEIMKRFGLNCYGCCEPLDFRWEVVRKFPALRRVSTSPWANRKKMNELLGRNYVMSLKPSPTPLAMSHLDEDDVRRAIRDDLRTTMDNHVEYIMKDNHTLGGNPGNATRWVEMVREEINRL